MIRQLGDRWQVYGRRGGKQVYLATVDSKREAKDLEEDHRVTQRKIADKKLPPHTDLRLTFAIAVKRWLKALEDASSPSWSEYKSRIDLHVLPTFGEMLLVDIRRSDVIAWRDRWALASSLSAKTVNTVLGTLSSAFSYFVDSDLIGHNPCHRVKSLKTTAKVYPWLESTEAITRLLGECGPSLRNIVAVLVGTGMRLGECLWLTWDCIDLEHRIITVKRGKGGKMRRVPIFDSVLPVLKAMKVARGGNVFLWPGAKPGRPLSQPSVYSPFKTAAAAAELSTAMRVHDLRHSFASLFLIDGGDIFKLSRILGHSSVAITERTYAHLKPTAYETDYGRVRFAMPSAGGNVIALVR